MADVIEVGVQWREAGGDVPERTKTHLKGLRDAADQAAPSIGDRMGQAFERLERREPTMLLRRVKLMVDELGASALGASGPLGRLAFSLTSLIPGGALTLGVVGGVAAIGAEVKHILEFTDALDASLLKLNTGLGAGTRAAPLFGAMGRDVRIEDLTNPFGRGFWSGMGTTISNTLADMLSDPSGGAFGRPVVSGASIGRAAELATEETGARIERQMFHNQAIQAERERTKAVQESVLALDKARLGLHPTNAQLEALAQRADQLKLTTARLNEEQKQTIENNERLTRVEERQNEILKEREAIMTKAGFAAPGGMTENQRAAALGVNFPGVARERRGGIQGQGGALVSDVGIMAFTGGVAGSSRAAAPADDIGLMGLRGGVTVGITEAGQAELRRQELVAAMKEQTFATRAVEGTMRGLIVSLHEGTPAALVKGVLGGVAQPLGEAAAKGMHLTGLAAGAVAGGIAGVVTGLSSLIGSSHKPRIIISAFEEQALQEIRNLRADPLTTSYVIVGPVDSRQLQYQLGRLQRRDAVTRLP